VRRRRAFARGQLSVGHDELARALRPQDVRAVAEMLGRRPLGVTTLDPEGRARFGARLKERFPDVGKRIIAAAAAVCDHRFDILGSGPVDLGPTIDWSLDFKSGFRWPAGFSLDLNPVDLANAADVKVPWELSRCQHFVTLGQAYWLTGDERYAREFVEQLRSWIAANPVMGTINWVNAMEAAIRIVNWLWAVALFRDSEAFGGDDRTRLLVSALEHGRFIVENLETWSGHPSSNHYIADLVGLTYLGVLLPELREARRWRETGLNGLFRELSTQVHEDGVDYECALGYHRLVTEMVGSAFAVCGQNGVTIPKAAWDRLERMFEFCLWYTRPDGSAPLVGDADDGRLHILTPGAPSDHRHLLAFGGWLLARPTLLSAAGEFAHEAAWWSGVAEEHLPPAPELPSRGFADGGFYVLRRRDRYLLAVCSDPRGPTGHAHNDTLSFELATVRPWIVDSGTFVYTGSSDWRHQFRATAAHNTVWVDGMELNPIRADQPFLRARQAIPLVKRWETSADYDLLDVEHGGFSGLGIVHRRRFYFGKRAGHWLVEDTLRGDRSHDVDARLHFDRGIALERCGRSILATSQDERAKLHVTVRGLPEGSEIAIGQGWLSRGYGQRELAPVLSVHFRTLLPIAWTWGFTPATTSGDDVDALAATLIIPVAP